MYLYWAYSISGFGKHNLLYLHHLYSILIGFPINSTFLEKWNEEIQAVGSSVAVVEKHQKQPNDIFSMETLNILTIVWYPKSIEFGLSLSSVGGGTTGALLLPAALLVLQPLGEVIT